MTESDESVTAGIEAAVTAGAAPSYDSDALTLSRSGEVTLKPAPMTQFAQAALSGVEPVIPEDLDVGDLPEVRELPEGIIVGYAGKGADAETLYLGGSGG